MNSLPSTLRIQTYRAFNIYLHYSYWVEWAVDMLMTGYETENILLLASESEPFNSWEMDVLIEKVYAEHHLPTLEKEVALKEYTRFLVEQVVEGKKNIRNVLSELNEFYEVRGENMSDFALLYWSMSDNQDFLAFFGSDAVDVGFDEFALRYFRNYLNTAV